MYEKNKLLKEIKILYEFKHYFEYNIKRFYIFFKNKEKQIESKKKLLNDVKIFEQFQNQFLNNISLLKIRQLQSDNDYLLKVLNQEIYQKELMMKNIEIKLQEIMCNKNW